MSDKEKECFDNGHHDWSVDYYDDYHMISFMATCNVCGVFVDTSEYGVGVENDDYDELEDD